MTTDTDKAQLDASILDLLNGSVDQSARQIASSLDAPIPAVSGALRRLGNAGLVNKGGDSRSLMFWLTASAKASRSKAAPTVLDKCDVAIETLTRHEAKATRAIDAVTARMQSVKDAWPCSFGVYGRTLVQATEQRRLLRNALGSVQASRSIALDDVEEALEYYVDKCRDFVVKAETAEPATNPFAQGVFELRVEAHKAAQLATFAALAAVRELSR